MSPPLFLLTRWKPYEPIEHIHQFIEKTQGIQKGHIKHGLAVSYQILKELHQRYSGIDISLGAIEMPSVDEGAFTQSISGKFLKAAGAAFVLIGSYFERSVQGVGSGSIRLKLLESLREGITPILCVGETAGEYQGGAGKKVVESQLRDALEGFSADELKRISVFFEAPWAMQLPYRPTSKEILQGCVQGQEILEEVVGKDVAEAMQIISCVPEDIGEILPAAHKGIFAHHHYVHDISRKALEEHERQLKEKEIQNEVYALEAVVKETPLAEEAISATEELSEEKEPAISQPEEFAGAVQIEAEGAESEGGDVDGHLEEEKEKVSGFLGESIDAVKQEETEDKSEEAHVEESSEEKSVGTIEEKEEGESGEVLVKESLEVEREDIIQPEASSDDIQNASKPEHIEVSHGLLPPSPADIAVPPVAYGEQSQPEHHPRKERKDHKVSDINT